MYYTIYVRILGNKSCLFLKQPNVACTGASAGTRKRYHAEVKERGVGEHIG